MQAAKAGASQLSELTGKPTESIIGIEGGQDGQWVVTVEVVEDARIPSSTDLLASYRIELSAEGGLEAYQRLKRYARGHGNEGPSGE